MTRIIEKLITFFFDLLSNIFRPEQFYTYILCLLKELLLSTTRLLMRVNYSVYAMRERIIVDMHSPKVVTRRPNSYLGFF